VGNSLLVKRGDYDRVKDIISSLTYQQLAAAATELRETRKTSDPSIGVLRRAIQVVAARVPNSFAKKQDMRLHIRALFVEFGPAAFWLTLNPSDLRDPLVLKLAGITIPNGRLEKTTAALRRKTATMNPSAIAVFFHKVCTGIFKGLICPENGEAGILGHVSTYFGVVETNGRGMLHLHCLIWLMGNLDFVNLRERLLHDSDFSLQMVEYLDSVIYECIDSTDIVTSNDSFPSTEDFACDDTYEKELQSYANAVAAKRQVHSEKHNSTCFKYCKKGERQCRFSFPRPKVDASYVDDLGVVHLRRDNEWVNPFNPCIAAAIGSNQDLSFLSTRTKALSMLYYITNYATKDEASTYQMVTAAAILKKTLEQASQLQETERTDEDHRVLGKGMTNFSLRVFNRMCHDREVSGVQVASSLLQLPEYYTPHTELRRINLYYLRQRFEAIIQASTNSCEADDEQVTLSSKEKGSSIFDDYRWRGSDFSHLCLYEYVKFVRKRLAQNRTRSDVDFEPQHPEYGRKTQFLCATNFVPRTVALVGTLSENQSMEDGIRGGHPKTVAMEEDLATILLALFVPWQVLPSHFGNVAATCHDESPPDSSPLSLSATVWHSIKESLPDHIQDFARNVELLRKSQEDAEIDRLERKAMASAMESLGFDIDTSNREEDIADQYVPTKELIDDNTLHLSYSLIKSQWLKEDRLAAATVPALQQSFLPVSDIVSPTFTSLGGQSTCGFRQDIGPDTLKLWSDLLKSTNASSVGDNVEGDANDGDDFNFGADEDSAYFTPLQPILSFASSFPAPSVADLTQRMNPNPSASHITDLISEIVPLNSKQRRVVSMIMYRALKYRRDIDVGREDQFLVFVTGEGGTGKTRIIEAVKLGMALLQRGNEVIVTAPTGNAASNIHGSTIHTSLDVGVGRHRKRKPSQRVRSLWADKTILIVDEISMVGSRLLDSIDKQCKLLKNLDPNSTAVFGGLPIVFLLGDFHQFSPVQSKALWQTQDHNDEKRGQQLWHMFQDVVILDEPMRQQQDPEYYNLLKRARNGLLTEADVDLLNSRVVTRLEMRSGRTNTCIVRTNRLRHLINRLQIERFARKRRQKIFIFPAHHTRWKKAMGLRDLAVDQLFEVQDGSDVKGAGLLMYTQDMPSMILSNICTPLGIVNGAQGKAIGVVPDPNSMYLISIL